MQMLINACPEDQRVQIVEGTNEEVYTQMGGYPAQDQYCGFVDAFNAILEAR